MAAVTGEDWRNVMNLAGVSDTDAEYILDMAIDLLNVYDVQLDNMAGLAGAKTVTLTSKQRGGVFLVARTIYYAMYKNVQAIGIGGLTVSASDLLSNATVVKTVKEVANRLCSDNYTRIPFTVATDESGIS